MTAIEELLRSVIGTGEIINITYNGGSRPGQPREVIPISLSNQKLVAVEPATHKSKHYKLELIARVELSNGEHGLNLEVVPPQAVLNLPKFDTLSEYSQFIASELQDAGWHIYESETSFAIAPYFNNGKPRKTPIVSIQYSDPSFERIFDIESGRFKTVRKELTGREKPWHVNSRRLGQGRSFAILKKAIELFIEEARAIDPNAAYK